MWKQCGFHMETMWCPHLKPYGVHTETTWYPHGNHVVTIWTPHVFHVDTKTWYVMSLQLLFRSRKVNNLWMPVTSLIIVWFSIREKFWKAGSCRSPSYPWVGTMLLPCAILFRSLDWNGNNHIIPACGNNGEWQATTWGMTMWCPCGNHVVVHLETMWCPHFETMWCPPGN